MPGRQRGEIVADILARRLAPGRQQRLAVLAAVTHGHFLWHGIHAVRRRNQQGFVRCHQTTLHGPRRLHQLGRQHHIHIARHRHQTQYRLPAGAALHRQDFNVVNRGPGPLGHAGHRGRLGIKARLLGRTDHPVGQHAASLPAHGENGNFDGYGLLVRPHGDTPFVPDGAARIQ